MFSPLRKSWRKLQRSIFTRWHARALGASPKNLDISGPCVIHGGGKFVVGQNVSLRATPRLPIELFCAPGAVLTLEDGCFLNQGVRVVCCQEIIIGEYSLFGDESVIMDCDFHGVGDSPAKTAPVIVEQGVWVGTRAIIIKGVTLGTGCVVGAGAVVTRSVPSRSLVVGNPARIVRQW
jgi:acetyltransferase-like isoleucine patch superfamily enzyme